MRHHLLDPATGEPAFTGLIAVTALAPTGVEAEALAKTALLSGPAGARDVLARHGGVAFDEAGRMERVGAAAGRPGRAPAHARAEGGMTSVPTPLEHGWWIASRSAGIVALLAITASVILGLLMANGLPRRKGATRVLVSLHESTALAGLIAIAVHGVTLLGDPWMHATLWKISVPFSIGYRPLWTSLGIIAGWIAAALGLSYYARQRIGTRLWRKLHRATVVAWALGIAHTIGAGHRRERAAGCR